MTTGEFAELVEKMRKAQKEYFRTRTQEALAISKNYESEVDKVLAERNARINREKNPELFDIY